MCPSFRTAIGNQPVTFGETQSYVRLVLQNLAMYERLYQK